MASSQELSDSISEAAEMLLRNCLSNLRIFAETQLQYVYDDKTRLAHSLRYFEGTNRTRVVVADGDGNLLGSEGAVARKNTEALSGLFDSGEGFADIDTDGDGVREYAVYCSLESADKEKITVISIYDSNRTLPDGILSAAKAADTVYFVRDDGLAVMRVENDGESVISDNARELESMKRIRQGERAENGERGSVMLKNGSDRYSAAYSRVGIDWNNSGYYVLVVSRKGSLLRESDIFLYRLAAGLLFFAIVGIPFICVYCKYVRLDMLLANSVSANEAKTRFLSKFSHDFRTPMNALIGMTELAGQSVDDPREVAYCLNKITTSADYMLGMLSDILDISRIESDKLELVKESFDLLELIRSINTLMYVQAEGKNITFTIRKRVPSDILLVGDSVRLKQVFVNLISNAIKFTNEGGRVQFHADETYRDAERVHICFRVIDDGIGMSREFMERMYDPFECERDAGMSEGPEGAGLGLAICRSLIELMGGTIEAQSRVGAGTEFAVDLDFCYTVKPESRKNTVNISAKYDFRGRRVLLADDNLTNLDIAARLLKGANIEVDMATDGQKAMERYLGSRDGYYDAILLDVRMPVKNGLEAAHDIRHSGRNDSDTIPIAAITANAFGEDREEAAKYGINIYLTKPVKMQTLYAGMAKLFGDQFGFAGSADTAAAAEGNVSDMQ